LTLQPGIEEPQEDVEGRYQGGKMLLAMPEMMLYRNQRLS